LVQQQLVQLPIPNVLSHLTCEDDTAFFDNSNPLYPAAGANKQFAAGCWHFLHKAKGFTPLDEFLCCDLFAKS